MIQVLINDQIAGNLKWNLNGGSFIRIALGSLDALDDMCSVNYDLDIDMDTGIAQIDFPIVKRNMRLQISEKLMDLGHAKAHTFAQLRRTGVPEYAETDVFKDAQSMGYIAKASWNAIQCTAEEGELLFDLSEFEPV
jgi:hypothetical protein